MSTARILYCHCAYAGVIPDDVKEEVLRHLDDAGVAFDAVPDLCEMAARKDPALEHFAASTDLKIAACFPRAVKWLFHASGYPLPEPLSERRVEILNLRETPVATVIERLRPAREPARAHPPAADEGRNAEPPFGELGAWTPWFPVIDYDRCTNCMQCLTFCLFDVYGVDDEKKITVQNESHCKTDCPACARVCPEVAILFPKYAGAPINGDTVDADDIARGALKVDISALLGGDLYGTLRTRSEGARRRFSTERDESRALLERKRCLKTLAKKLDIPNEVLMTLPSAEDIEARAARARAKLEKRRADSRSVRDEKPAPTEDDWGI